MNVIIYTQLSLLMLLESSVMEWFPHYVMHRPKLAKLPVVGWVCNLLIQDHKHHHIEYPKGRLVCAGTHVHEYQMQTFADSCFRVTQFLWVGFLLLVIGVWPFVILDYITNFQYQFTLITVITFYSYYLVYELLHNAFHRSNSWYTKFAPKWVMRIYARRHEIHHTKHSGKNLTNFLPVADYIFGTEHGASPRSIMAWRFVTIGIIFSFLITLSLEQA